MFDDLQNKKDDKVDDIFADTDANLEENIVEEEKKVDDKKETAPPLPPNSSVDLEKNVVDEDIKIPGASKKPWLKIVIILVIVFVLTGGAYLAVDRFGILDKEVVEEEVEDFTPSSPELVDPSLIIPEKELSVSDIINTYNLDSNANVEIVSQDPLVFKILETITIEKEKPSEDKTILNSYIELFGNFFVDTDGDGLSDLAENYIGTNINSVDTDFDGFSDYDELVNGYNPLGEGLLPSDFIAKKYTNNGFSFFYPQNWQVEESQNNTWKLIAPDQSFVEITKKTSDHSNVLDWYINEFNQGDWLAVEEERRVVNNNMDYGIIVADGSMVAFVSSDGLSLFNIYISANSDGVFKYYRELALVLNTLVQE
jgi:hypothetical protein